jgi:predicted peroxiredoxin
MKVGIALGVATVEMATAALERAISELGRGRAVELFLVFGGVGLYTLAEKQPKVHALLDDALTAGMELSACRSCEVAHGARKRTMRRPQRAVHLFRLWWRSDVFVFAGRFRNPQKVRIAA